MKKLTYFLIVLLLTTGFVYAADPSASSTIILCGQGDISTACHVSDVLPTSKRLFAYFAAIGVFVIAIAVFIVGIRFIIQKDKAAVLKENKQRLVNVVLGIVLLLGAGTIFIAALKALGVQDQFLKVFGTASIVPSFVDHAYAAGDLLPSPTIATNLYDFMILVMELIVRWFVFPVVVYGWLYVGYMFVKAQGNPQELVEARKWLWYVFIGTVIVIFAEGFAFALRDTVLKIFTP